MGTVPMQKWLSLGYGYGKYKETCLQKPTMFFTSNQTNLKKNQCLHGFEVYPSLSQH